MLDNHLKYPNALPKGYTLEHYRIIKPLTEDNVSLTYLASTLQQGLVVIVEYLPKHLALRDKTNHHILLKGPNCKYEYEWGLSHYQQETKQLRQLKHPNINCICDTINTNNTFYKISNYISGVNLSIYLQNRKLNENKLIALLAPLLAGLNTIHQLGYLHGALTPYNIIIEHKSKRPVITNLGSIKHLFVEHKNSLTALPTNYAAYEQYHAPNKQGVWTDIYAIGAILYQLITNIKPTESTIRIKTTLEDIGNDPLIPAQFIVKKHLKEHYSEQFLAAIDHALKLAVTERPHNIRIWEEELGMTPKTQGEDISDSNENENVITQMQKQRKEELIITGLSTTSNTPSSYIDFDTLSQPLTINEQLANNNKRYMAILLLISLIAIIAGSAFYYIQLSNKPDQEYKRGILNTSFNTVNEHTQ